MIEYKRKAKVVYKVQRALKRRACWRWESNRVFDWAILVERAARAFSKDAGELSSPCLQGSCEVSILTASSALEGDGQRTFQGQRDTITDESVQVALPQWHALSSATRDVRYRCCARVEVEVEVELRAKRQRRASARAAFLIGTSLVISWPSLLLSTTSRQHSIFMAGILCGLYSMVCNGTGSMAFVGESDDTSSTILLYRIRSHPAQQLSKRHTFPLLHGALNREIGWSLLI